MDSDMKDTSSVKRKPLTSRLSSFDLTSKSSNESKPVEPRKQKNTPKDVTRTGIYTDKEKTGKWEHDKDAEKRFGKLLEGNLDDLPQLPHSVVRIFLSSTFSDMRAERNTLARDVYPKLKEMCSKYDLDFQVVDMRWGVTEDSQNDHSVEKICLLEIENCQKVSLGPNFVLISGDRYGFRPIPTEIDVEEFRNLLQCAKERKVENIKLLETWYLLDENAKPPKYVLQPIRSQFPFYGDYSPGCDEHRQKDTENWRTTFTSLQDVLRKAANSALEAKKLAPHRHHQYFLSVTECEINKGILEASNPTAHVLVYHRKLTDISTDALSDGTIKRYLDIVDLNGDVQINEEVKHLREDLTFTKIPNIMKNKGCRSYTMPWKPGGINPGDQKEHLEYISNFCSSFIKDVTDLVERALHEKEIRIRRSDYFSDYQEILHHLHFCKMKCKAFCGQEGILQKARDYILNDTSRKPFVFHAPSGAGKTSVMAMVMNSLSSWFKDKDYVGVIRFLGTSPTSINIYDVLRSVCGQLADNAELVMEPVAYRNKKNLVEYIPRFLRRVANKLKTPIVILLDSLDQLSKANDSYLCTWLPVTLPVNIKLILSTLPEEHGILNNLRKILPQKDCFCEIPALSENTGREIIDKYLGLKQRSLTGIQERLLLKQFAVAPGPLFLKLLLDEAVKWNSYTPDHQLKLGSSIQRAINHLFENLEKKFGHVVTGHALGFITIGLNGITETEIEDALSCDDEALDDVYRYHNPPVDGIVRIPSVLWARIHYEIQEYLVERISYGKYTLNWYHRQFTEAARSRYATGPQAEKLHAVIAETFMAENGVKRDIKLTRRKLTIKNADRQVTPKPMVSQNRRTLTCLPFHVIHAGNYIEESVAKDSCLCNFRFLKAKLSAFSKGSILDDLSDFLERREDEEIKILRHFFSVCQIDFPLSTNLAVNLLSFINTNPEHTSLKKLLQQAEEFLSNNRTSALVPLYPGLAPRRDTSSALTNSFQECVSILSESPEKALIHTCGKKSDDESKDVHAIFDTLSGDLFSVSLPEISKPTLVHKLDQEGNRILYTEDGQITTFNLSTMKATSSKFEEISTQLTKNSKPVLTIFSSDTAHLVILFQDGTILVIETFGMKKAFLVKLKEEATNVSCLVCTKSENLKMAVLGRKEAADKGPSMGFVRMYYPGQENTEKYVQFGHPFAGGLFGLCSSERLLVAAVNNGDSSKIICMELESLEETTEVILGSEIIQLATSKSKPMAAVLTKKGSVCIADCSVGKIDHELITNNPVTCFGVNWTHNLVFLGDVQGQIAVYSAKTGKKSVVFPAHPKAVQNISVLDDHVITLGKNQELNVWLISAILKDMYQSKSDLSSDAKLMDIVNQKEVCSFYVNTDSFVTASRGGIVRIWSLNSVHMQLQYSIGIEGDKIQIAADNICVALDKSSGHMKLFDIKDGTDVFSDLPNNSLDFTLSKDMNDIYVLSKDKGGLHHVNIIDLKLRKMKKSFPLKPGLKYETIDISVNATERYLILRYKCTQEDLKDIEASWKKQGSYQPQYHPYRFAAVDLLQASGGLALCFRLLTKIPCLGEVIEAYEGNTMMITCRSSVLFWDIATGKCTHRIFKGERKGMMARFDWIGWDCKGTSLAMSKSHDGTTVAIGSEDGYLFIYSAASGLPVEKRVPSTKHNSPVICVAGSADSKWFVSACRNHVIKLWDTNSGMEIFSFRVDSEVRQMKFSQNSNYLVVCTGSHMTRMLVYRLNSR